MYVVKTDNLVTRNEIAFKTVDAAMSAMKSLLENDYVVCASIEENLIILNYEYVQYGDRNGVVFVARDNCDDMYVDCDDDINFEECDVPDCDIPESFKNTVYTKVKRLSDNAVVPTFGSEYAAGTDLRACIEDDIIIEPHKTVKIGTGLAMEIPNGMFGAIFARSGLATKEGLRPANCVGVVDSDYRGEYIVALHNDTDEQRVVHNGDRIAQLVIIPFKKPVFIETDELSDSDRGSGGFGSTGKN